MDDLTTIAAVTDARGLLDFVLKPNTSVSFARDNFGELARFSNREKVHVTWLNASTAVD